MKRLFAATALFTMMACEDPPLPPPPPKPPTPKISLVPTTAQIEALINGLDKDYAETKPNTTEDENATIDAKISTLVIYAGDTASRDNTIQALLKGLADPRPKVKTNVAKTIQALAARKIRDPRMVDALIPLLTDEDSWARIESGRALARFCDKKIVPIMISRLDDKKDPEKVQVALEALQTMSGENVGKTAKDWKKWWDSNEATFEEKCNAKK